MDYAQISSVENLMVIVDHTQTLRLYCSVDLAKANLMLTLTVTGIQSIKSRANYYYMHSRL